MVMLFIGIGIGAFVTILVVFMLSALGIASIADDQDEYYRRVPSCLRCKQATDVIVHCQYIGLDIPVDAFKDKCGIGCCTGYKYGGRHDRA